MSEETRLLYLEGIEGSYLREAEVEVRGYENGGYVLSQTMMHYQGGGQPGDNGFLASGETKIPVYNVKKKGQKVLHLSRTSPDISQGKLVVNWERRYGIMKMHTLQHAISSVIFKEGFMTMKSEVFPGYGFIEMDKALTDIPDGAYRLNESDRNVRRFAIKKEEMDPQVLKRCNLEKLPKSLTEISMVEIDGLDLCACAGTHLRNTLEIGKYWLRGMGRRLEFGLF